MGSGPEKSYQNHHILQKARLQLARLRAYQIECYGKQKAFITPAITRWGTQLGAIMSSLANKDALRAYARDAIVLNSLKAKAVKAEEEEEDRQVLKAILSSTNNFEFWHEVEMLAKVLQPIEHAQRCSERDHSCIGEVIPRWLTIQAKWDALEEANQDPLINYSELRQWRVQRMKGQTTDIHHFAFALDPRTTTGEGLGLDTMERAHRFLEENTTNGEYQQLFGEFCRFRAREGALFGPTSRIYRDQPKTPHTPSHYYALSAWGYFGSMGVKLATLARRVLGSLANSVPSERSFSATNYLHCKLRNRLSPLSTDKATFIYTNCRVLRRLKMVNDNPAESIVNWETVDVARLIKIENAFQDSYCCRD
ncbi:transposase [Metarhizium guizhouense ARSEF 977]|uniref:Transposase n=1 Tax=Metarhizium guizhouense (strain ARSEF 977) TaxID=1276136 RepID=A0A0B4GMS6_METGA|nr:transposase [Metarhizium guizhouense ARSEF 977]